MDGDDVSGLVIQTSLGSSVKGRIAFDSYLGTNTPRPDTVEILPVPVDPDHSSASPVSANIHEDGSFEVAGLNGPRRLELVRAPIGWTLKEIRVRGIDVTDRVIPFGRSDQSLADVEVVLSDRINDVSGAIVDDRARPVPGSHVVVFAADRDLWYPASRFVRLAAAGTDGAIALAGLPPGSYYAAAVATLPADGGRRLAGAGVSGVAGAARAFALGEAQKQVLNLKLDTK